MNRNANKTKHKFNKAHFTKIKFSENKLALFLFLEKRNKATTLSSMYRHRIRMETQNHHHLKNIYRSSHPSLHDNFLSSLNQVYYATRQVPQQHHLKPRLTFLPIIQHAPNIYENSTSHTTKSAFMSSALLSSVHSIDFDSKTNNAYFKTVIGPKRKSSAKSGVASQGVASFKSSKNARSCSSVMSVQSKSVSGMGVQNVRPEETGFRLQIKEANPKATASATIIRDKHEERAFSRALTLSSIDTNKVKQIKGSKLFFVRF
jgi:hypothetical protein